jgi:predicted nucleic acid-binding protein
MGIVLDSSAVIHAERRGDTVLEFLQNVAKVGGEQKTVLSSVGLTELVTGVHAALSAKSRAMRESFLQELLRDISVYPYTRDTAILAGRVAGEQQTKGITIPLADLLIGVTALELGYSILTLNVRHFRLVPGLAVLHFPV